MVKFSCKSQTKGSGNETVTVAREVVPWTAFYANDNSGRVEYIEATCGVDGSFSPSVEDYTCTRDCEAPEVDGSIMGSKYRVTIQVVPNQIQTKVPYLYMGLILKRYFCFDVNGRFGTT